MEFRFHKFLLLVLGFYDYGAGKTYFFVDGAVSQADEGLYRKTSDLHRYGFRLCVRFRFGSCSLFSPTTFSWFCCGTFCAPLFLMHVLVLI